jgi:hypothetical protein
LSRIPAGHFGLLLEAIQLLNDGHRQYYIIILEAQHGIWVMQEDIGIQDVNFSHTVGQTVDKRAGTNPYPLVYPSRLIKIAVLTQNNISYKNCQF